MHSIRVGDATIAYRDSGRPGRPVAVLLHGGGSTSATWDTFTPPLCAAGYRVIAPDLRGHGASGRHRRYPLPAYRYDRRALLSAIRQLREPDAAWWAALARVPAPTLVISGGPTSHVSPRRLAELAQALPAGTLAAVPVGHRIHSLAPVAFAATTLPFLTAA